MPAPEQHLDDPPVAIDEASRIEAAVQRLGVAVGNGGCGMEGQDKSLVFIVV